MILKEDYTLANGVRIPKLGLGTWFIEDGDAAEAGRQAVGKNGVVKDPKAHKQVLHALLAFFAGQRCRLEQLTYSPITGGEGNIEYLAALTYVPGSPVPVNAWDVDGLVEQAHRCLRGRPNN